MARRTFAIVSWGYAGTSWLAHALDAHPDISAAHHGKQNLEALGYSLDARLYVEVLKALAFEHALVGDVHSLNRSEVATLKTALGDYFRHAVVVREPLARLRSALAHYHRSNFVGWDLTYLETKMREAGYDWDSLSLAERMTLLAVNNLDSARFEIEVGPFYRMEDLVQNPSALTDLVQHLSAGALGNSGGWAERVIGEGARNSHSMRASIELTEFAMEALDRLVSPQSWAIYGELGYTKPASAGAM